MNGGIVLDFISDINLSDEEFDELLNDEELCEEFFELLF